MSTDRLAVAGLRIEFPDRTGAWHRVVDDVSFELHAGERIGLVGESGCGKSLTGLATLGLVPEPGRIVEGSIHLNEQSILGSKENDLDGIRGGRVGIVFQEAKAAFNPVFTVGYQIGETIREHLRLSAARSKQKVLELLAEVDFDDPESISEAYPHQLSGGEAQRAMMALALAPEPSFLIADEPTTALDVTIQARILQLLDGFVTQRQIGLLLISHDLAVVRAFVDKAMVMYAGQVVEFGDTDQVLASPLHPYTRLLSNTAQNRGETETPGMPPSIAAGDRGCSFEPRCQISRPECLDSRPPLEKIDDGRLCRCPIVTAGEVEP